MDLIVKYADLTELKVDAIIVTLCEDALHFNAATERIEKATQGLLSQHLKDHEFEAKELETLVLHAPIGVKAKHVIVVGLGKQGDISPVILRKAAAKAIKQARSLKSKTVAMPADGEDVLETAQALAEGLLLGNYQFTRYKTQDVEKREKAAINSALIVADDPTNLEKIQAGINKGEAIATAILNARDIINEPPSRIKPTQLVEAAQEISSLSNNISLTVLDEDRLREEKFNAILAVASGSEEKPYLIHLHYKPAHPKRSIAFVGKGVTFDSGGLGIKPWSAMLSMKSDMAGGATVLGIFQALAELENIGQPLDVEVHGIIPTTENMISGKAMRPDDIIETRSGKTIEILHTDAEGRLILADGLTYATELKPELIIDYATLTGAAIKALGMAYSAVMGNDIELMNLIKQASFETGESVWELPLPKEYKRYLESSVADLQNVTTADSAPGAIYAGLFLQEFVNDIPWAHLDIAGPSMQNEEFSPINTKGATGYGILLGVKLLEFLTR